MDEAEEGIMRLGEAYHLLQYRCVSSFTQPIRKPSIFHGYEMCIARKHKLVLKLNPFLDLGDSDVITDTQIRVFLYEF